jgi:sugar lactone lactonase YvrE
MTTTVTVFREARAILGESLVADAAAAVPAMLWCDITAGLIHRSPIDGAPDGSDDTVVALEPPVASFHLAEIADDAQSIPGFVVSLGDRVVLADRDGAVLRTLATIDHAHPGLRLNEGKADPFGRWVTGSMDLTTGAPDGAFYSVAGAGSTDPEGTQRVLRGGFGTANGIEFSRDGGRIWFTDTSVQTIYTGDYGPSGEITGVETFHSGEMHDGLVLDDDGCLWGAVYGAGVVIRYDGAGTELDRFEFPAPNLTSVAFGGGDSRTLYVTSARENLTEHQLLAHPLSGSVFALQTGTTGRAAPVFLASLSG